ncbi:hypothetical protein QP029_06940 [Corynebacterium suedekumii]|uniref:Uncharacterized protein n=1 Tax=Corynebacterium suedekumii TaxID=3049801 RepID=A0ABY8VTY6_9CORY|nr:hypothetical protein [Corynebacterium suedekumii]WIM71613.1 hypothetical protein QP029_06940 [Corynebacterium suedekumii]
MREDYPSAEIAELYANPKLNDMARYLSTLILLRRPAVSRRRFPRWLVYSSSYSCACSISLTPFVMY